VASVTTSTTWQPHHAAKHGRGQSRAKGAFGSATWRMAPSVYARAAARRIPWNGGGTPTLAQSVLTNGRRPMQTDSTTSFAPWLAHCIATVRAHFMPAGSGRYSRVESAVRQLPAGTLLSIAQPRHRVVHCETGCLWLTVDHDARDILLRPGQAHRCDRDDRLLIQALDDASFTVA
jgi:hypothetical protein